MVRKPNQLVLFCLVVNLCVGLAARREDENNASCTAWAGSTVSIKDLSCTNLVNDHTLGIRKLNPYIKVKVNLVKQKTFTLVNDLNPDFRGWEATFKVAPMDELMNITILDEHSTESIVYGYATVNFRELEQDKWIEHKRVFDKGKRGSIQFSILWHPVPMRELKKTANQSFTTPAMPKNSTDQSLTNVARDPVRAQACGWRHLRAFLWVLMLQILLLG
eukprot:TRINITY_DN31001_c0_g1_i1.p1 TRINITY_DN31001_c0_g1~~TRINITY_DN31001_c0_g1_i1.p1  ORF type:complete len:219 (-),score=11.66 TRINITY_DN31001_c0_g1_i1:161-817(-)